MIMALPSFAVCLVFCTTIVAGRNVVVPVSTATPTEVWGTEVCSKSDLWKAGVQMAKANVLVCQAATSMASVYAISMKDGSVVFEATDVQPGSLSYELDSVGDTLYALQPIAPPYSGYNVTKFQPKSITPKNSNLSSLDLVAKNAPPQWPRQEPVLYSGWMGASLTSVVKGVLKQWDESGVGLCDHSLEVDWVGELEFPVTPYGATMTVRPVYGHTRGGIRGDVHADVRGDRHSDTHADTRADKNADTHTHADTHGDTHADTHADTRGSAPVRPVGIVSWYFTKDEQFLYRLDGKRDPNNNTLLLPEWRVKLTTNLQDAYSKPPEFYLANDGHQDVVVLLDTAHEAPRFRLFAVATGEELTPAEGYPIPDFGKVASVSLTPSFAGDIACVHTWSNPPPPVTPPPPTPPRPTPNPHSACVDITSGKNLWSLPMYHRTLHPGEGWQNHEIGGSILSAGANTLVQQTLTYVYDEEKKYWVSKLIRIRAFSKSSGKPLWTMPAPQAQTKSWWINADTTGDENFFVSFNTTLSKYAF